MYTYMYKGTFKVPFKGCTMRHTSICTSILCAHHRSARIRSESNIHVVRDHSGGNRSDGESHD